MVFLKGNKLNLLPPLFPTFAIKIIKKSQEKHRDVIFISGVIRIKH